MMNFFVTTRNPRTGRKQQKEEILDSLCGEQMRHATGCAETNMLNLALGWESQESIEDDDDSSQQSHESEQASAGASQVRLGFRVSDLGFRV